MFNKPILIDEILESIHILKSCKSQGTDGIVSEFYKKIHDLKSHMSCVLFNEIVDSGVFPDMWRDSNIVPVHKSGSKDDTSNFRGNSLNVLYQLFSNIVNKRF